jgi:hypothetical protein
LRIASRRRQNTPVIGGGVILLDTRAVVIAVTEVDFAIDMSLHGGALIPGDGLAVGLRDALASVIEFAEHILGFGISLLRRELTSIRRFGRIGLTP